MSTANIRCSGTVYEFRAAPAAFTGLRANSIVSGMYGAVFGQAPTVNATRWSAKAASGSLRLLEWCWNRGSGYEPPSP